METILCVRSAQATYAPIGQTLEFDFSDDCPAGSSVLAYSVALGGFCVSYTNANSTWMGAFNVSLMPYLVGTKVYATPSAVYSDYAGDVGSSSNSSNLPAGYQTCFVQATALALIGTSVAPGDKVVLGNWNGVGNGDVLAGIPIGPNLSHWGYVAGFSFTAADPSGSYVSGLSYSVGNSVDGQGSMTLTASASTPSANASGTLDLLALSLPEAVCNFEVQALDIPFAPSPDLRQGLSGAFSATFTPPPGKSVTNVALLQQALDLVYGVGYNQNLTKIQASFSDMQLASATLTGVYNLNMYGTGSLGGYYPIGPSSTASIYAIAQFG